MQCAPKIIIDKNRINSMPRVEFKGAIHVVDSMLHVNAAVNVLRKSGVVGFDTETRPSFRKGVMHKTALIQISTASDCFLFRVNKIGVPTVLAGYLADAACLKVGLSLHDDFNVLHRMSDVEPAGFVDLQSIVGEYGIAEFSLQKIYAILFGHKISKGQRLTNWEAPELTAAQQQYAAIDAWACLKIYDYLKSGAFVPEQSPYLVTESDEE